MPRTVSRSWQPAKGLSVVDQKLAAELHLRQIDLLEDADAIGQDAYDAFAGPLNEAVMVAASDLPFAEKQRRGALLIERGFVASFVTLRRHLGRLLMEAHDSAVTALRRSVPRRWFVREHPKLSEAFEDELPIDFRRPVRTDIPGRLGGSPLQGVSRLEPIARNIDKIPEPEWHKILGEIVLPPPTYAEAEAIITAPDTSGISWTQRFQGLSRRIQSPQQVMSQLAFGFSQGDSIPDLRNKVLPLVDNIRASAQRIARTEGGRIAEAVQRRSWDSLGDLMVGVQILAVMDENTRPHHAARNGTVFYRNPTSGQKSMAELPMLPDEPNCRCWTSPVLAPPKEIETDPAVAAAFQNASGSGIPDPSTYDVWFSAVDDRRRRLAVGVRRYSTMAKVLAGQREPEWTDFIDQDGKLVDIATLRTETELERAARKLAVQSAINQRRSDLQQVSKFGFTSPSILNVPQLPPAPPPTPPAIPANQPNSPPQYAPGLEVMRPIEERIRAQTTHETLVVVSPDGRILAEKDGGKDYVVLDDKLKAAIPGAIVSHNHPGGWGYPEGTMSRGGRSLSKPDIAVATTYGAGLMRVVSPHWTFELEINFPKGVGPKDYWDNTVEPRLTRIDREVQAEFRARIAATTSQADFDIEIDRAEATHAHEVNTRLAKELNWRYERLPTND